MASIDNYTVGKGLVSFKKMGATAFADMGNCTEFEFTPEIEKLDHFSSRTGVRFKDVLRFFADRGKIRIAELQSGGAAPAVADALDRVRQRLTEKRGAAEVERLKTVLAEVAPDAIDLGAEAFAGKLRRAIELARHNFVKIAREDQHAVIGTE